MHLVNFLRSVADFLVFKYCRQWNCSLHAWCQLAGLISALMFDHNSGRIDNGEEQVTARLKVKQTQQFLIHWH